MLVSSAACLCSSSYYYYEFHIRIYLCGSEQVLFKFISKNKNHTDTTRPFTLIHNIDRSDVNEVIQKFLTQEDTQNQLLKLTVECQAKIDSLAGQRKQLKSMVDERKFSSAGNIGKRQVRTLVLIFRYTIL